MRRLLPDESPAAVQRTLERVLADPQIAVAPIGTPTPSPPSPLAPEVFKAIEIAARAVWKSVPSTTQTSAGVTIVPFMETGATDGLLLRNAGIPVYSVTGIAYDPDACGRMGRMNGSWCDRSPRVR